MNLRVATTASITPYNPIHIFEHRELAGGGHAKATETRREFFEKKKRIKKEFDEGITQAHACMLDVVSGVALNVVDIEYVLSFALQCSLRPHTLVAYRVC